MARHYGLTIGTPPGVGEQYQRNPTDLVNVSDAAVAAAIRARSFSDAVGVTDSLTVTFTPGGGFTHGDQLTDENIGLAGVGVAFGSLTNVGSISTSAHNQIIELLNVSGQILVQHNNVTIRKNRLLGDGINIRVNGLDVTPSTGCVIEDNDFDGLGQGAQSNIAYQGFIARRNHFYDSGEYIAPYGDCEIYENYMHDFADFTGVGAHQDGAQVEFGENVLIYRNKILQNVQNANSAIWVSSGEGPWDPYSPTHPHANVHVDDNLVAGGLFRVIGLGNQAHATGNKVSTIFSDRGYTVELPQNGRVIDFAGGSATHSGNTWADGPNAGSSCDDD